MNRRTFITGIAATSVPVSAFAKPLKLDPELEYRVTNVGGDMYQVMHKPSNTFVIVLADSDVKAFNIAYFNGMLPRGGKDFAAPEKSTLRNTQNHTHK